MAWGPLGGKGTVCARVRLRGHVEGPRQLCLTRAMTLNPFPPPLCHPSTAPACPELHRGHNRLHFHPRLFAPGPDRPRGARKVRDEPRASGFSCGSYSYCLSRRAEVWGE